MTFYPFVGVSSSNPEGAAIAWKFFKDNFATIKAKIGNASPSLMNAAITYSCYGLSSVKDIDDIEAFFEANPMPQNSRAISQTLEKKRATAKFVEKVKSSAVNEPSFWETL
jgi:aminopeptidase 2